VTIATDGQERITPEQVGAAVFPPARLGRRGVEEQHVREFLYVVQDELLRLHAERASLIDEVQRLRSRIFGKQDDMPAYSVGDAHQQAVRVLSSAQQTADSYVADAHAYSREITEEARRRGDEILLQARSRGTVQQADFPVPARPADDGEQARLEAELSRLRTHSEVCRTQMRTYLAVIAASVEEWERADSGLPTP
jgi:cell division septum initiation protein DivIVA